MGAGTARKAAVKVKYVVLLPAALVSCLRQTHSHIATTSTMSMDATRAGAKSVTWSGELRV